MITISISLIIGVLIISISGIFCRIIYVYTNIKLSPSTYWFLGAITGTLAAFVPLIIIILAYGW